MTREIYNDLWTSFYAAVTDDQCQLDPFIHQQQDDRRGITALAYLENNTPEITQKITQFCSAINEIEPSQYYYSQNQLHMTVLSIISCVEGLTLSDINRQQYIDVFQQALSNTKPIDIEFCGITASPSCILIQGFPLDSALAEIREQLRTAFGASGLNSTFDTRYKLITAHVSAIRFTTPFNNPQRLLQLCEQYRDYRFGRARLSKIELVFNDWYQTSSNTTSLAQQVIE